MQNQDTKNTLVSSGNAPHAEHDEELLRFAREGLCLALNFPRTPESGHFLQFLDRLIVRLGGIPSIIKDSRLPHTVVDASYPEAQRFRELLHQFDPKRRFRSELSDRLHL